jgi:hypothetical protein
MLAPSCANLHGNDTRSPNVVVAQSLLSPRLKTGKSKKERIMPFDALIAVEPNRTLQDVLSENGISPVSLDMLLDHKQAQLKRFGPSFWYRYQAVLSVALIVASPAIGAGAAAIHGFSPAWNSLSIGFSFAWMCMVALVTGTGIIRVRAGSHWRERIVPAGRLAEVGVPATIARVARDLAVELPRPTLILGELMREEAVLDPYLLIEHGDQCVCLGIWENDRIVASCRCEG